ncbi:DUF3159 domain-containing protein [Corynebacterium sp. USCH3]|uniref:DUF3159 domain-containing protein n=1 Tax=Corynebacterium sp. USCH3 TaxID=3024840 RepID=UPI0030EBBAB4
MTDEPQLPAKAPGDHAEGPDGPEGAAPTVLEQLGGLSGLVASVLPVLVLVPVNSRWGLAPALVAAVAVSVGVFLWRLSRRETLMPAVSGLMGVGICALIAWLLGDAKGYFAYGIWYSLVAGIVFVVSVLVRWPLVAVIWHGVNGSGHRWRGNRTAVRVYSLATCAWAVVFFGRFVVQQWLYVQDDAVGALGVARIIMGLPLTAVVVLVTVWAVRRASASEAAEDLESPGETGTTGRTA